MLDILFYNDISAFQRLALPVLKSQCALNSLKLGILEHCGQSRNTTGEHVFVLGIRQGVVVAIFIQTRSLYFYAREADFTESIHAAIDEFSNRRIKIPKIMGFGDTALRFAEAWKQRTKSGYQFAGKDFLYELHHLGSPQPVGTLQRATSKDMPRLIPLFKDYYLEDLGMTKTDEELEQSINEQLAEYEIYLWNDNGVKSMVTALLPFDSGVELANVFTPREYRKQGHATACITQVCKVLLQRYTSILLFVDQENIAANSLYTRIGFQLIDEMNSYTLSDP
jgi:predicted GNAT family acetyltransferase